MAIKKITMKQKQADGSYVEQYPKTTVEQIDGGLFGALIRVKSEKGATITITNGTVTYTPQENNGVWEQKVQEYGEWTINGAKGDKTASETVEVISASLYEVNLVFQHIWGVTWDGSSSTKWTRTDDAVNYSDPVPYVAGATTYGSPFDEFEPWAGMVRVTDADVGEMVAIPKFYYQLTTTSVKISTVKLDGYYTSPAHMDRKDGKGERDIVYVGRYKCASDYKSKSGEKPLAGIYSSFATSINDLKGTAWGCDYATRMTIRLLYLVEFADWNSQAKIGYGCSANGSIMEMGYTDSMPYHTGTTASSRTTYGGTQYRNIEGLWDNLYEWEYGFAHRYVYTEDKERYYSFLLGITPSRSGSYWTPKVYQENTGAPSIGSGWQPRMAVQNEFMFPFTSSSGSASSSTYVCDYYYCYGVANSGAMCCGGKYTKTLNSGLFYEAMTFSSGSVTTSEPTARPLILP